MGVLEDEFLHLVPGDEVVLVGVHQLEVVDVDVFVLVDGVHGVSLGSEDLDDLGPVLTPVEGTGVVGIGRLEESVGMSESLSLSDGVEGISNESEFLVFNLLLSRGEGNHGGKGDVLEHNKK